MSKKKLILLIGDMPGWAFDNIIQFVRKNSKEFDIYFDYTIYHPRINSQVTTDLSATEDNQAAASQFRKKIALQNIPILRGIVYRVQNLSNKLGFSDYDGNGKKGRIRKDNRYDLVVYLDYYMDKDADFSNIKATKIIRGIYTASFPPKGIKFKETISVEHFCQEYLSDASALVCGAPSIVNSYQKTLKFPAYFANLAYDENIFFPRKEDSKNKLFVLGWTGNPNREFKGFHSIILPAIEQLKAEGYSIELKTQFEGTLNSLADFWQGVDLAIIASEADAGPSMFMEASLCGVPSISTKIGMPEYVIEDGINGFFCERSVEDIVRKVKIIVDDKQLYNKFCGRIRKDYIEKLGVGVQVKNWNRLFKETIDL